MANLRPEDLVHRFNTRLRNVMNSGISWGTNAYPNTGGRSDLASSYSNLFGGSNSGVYSSPSASDFTGNADVSYVRDRIVAHASQYTAIRKVHVYAVYRRDGADTVIENRTRIGHLNSGYDKWVGDPSDSALLAGKDASLTQLEQYIDAVASRCVSHRNNTVSFSRSYCHSSCHTSCHQSCHGDGPGDGGGV